MSDSSLPFQLRARLTRVNRIAKADEEIRAGAAFPTENPNPVLRVALDARVLYANAAAAPLLAAWGCKIGDCLPEKSRASLAGALKAVQVAETEEVCGERVWTLAWMPVPAAKYVNVYCRDITERKRAEEALGKNEERYRSLFEHMPSGFALCRMLYQDGKARDWVYLDVNPAFGKLTGLRNVVGKKVSEVIPGIAETNPELFEVCGRVALSGEPEGIETFIPALGIWLSISVYSTEKKHFVAVFENITPRVVREREIERLNGLYATLSQISQCIVRARSREELLREVCAITAKYAGFKLVWIGCPDPQTHQVKPVARAGKDEGYLDKIKVYADERPEGRGPIGTCIREGKPSVFNDFANDPRAVPWHKAAVAHGMRAAAALPIRFRGEVWGALTVYSAEAGVFQDKEVALLEEAADDVSFALDGLEREAQRRRAEEALHESEASFRAVFDRSTVGKSLTAPDGKILKVNAAFAGMLGFTTEELQEVSFVAITHPEDVAKSRECMRSLLADERSSYRLEKRYRHKNGHYVWADVSTTLLRDNHGTPLYLITSILDITARKQLEEEFRQAQKMEAVGRLAGGVAHDFNNLLFVINGRTELVLNRLAPDDPSRSNLELIRRTGERGANLTRQLLAFSRRQVLQPKVLNLNDVIKNMGEMLRSLVHEDVSLTTVLSPKLRRTRADQGQIEQVLMNLVVNACDAMPTGGRLAIETANAELGEAYCRVVGCISPGPYAMMSVTDTGCGMDEHVKAHLFEPFFTTKEKGKGTGLGLATVYGIIRQSGGSLEVLSAPGQGAAFKVYLPQAQEAAVSSPRRSAVARLPARGTETVLLVEDEEGVRDLARDVLESHGYTVLPAGNGAEALRLQKQHTGRIHLVLTDVVMPRMDGPALVRKLRRGVPDIRVLFMSGYTDDAITDHDLQGEGIGLIQKPISPVDLARKVREILDQGR